MMKKGLKILGIFVIAIGITNGNMAVSEAKEDIMYKINDVKMNEHNRNWKEMDNFEQLIEYIEHIKKEYSDCSDEEIVNIISAQLNQAHVNGKRSYYNVGKNIVDIWNVLTPTEKKLAVRYPTSALQVNKARKIALQQTEKKFSYNGLGDKSDAFRHAIWNAEMTILIGENKAELFATAHEDKEVEGVEPDGFLKTEHKEMDLHNNAIGRKIGKQCSSMSEEQLADYIFLYLNEADTELIWLHE